MFSLMPDIIATLADHEFSGIGKVPVYLGYTSQPVSAPSIVVQEISNLPVMHTSSRGEALADVGYQVDVYARPAVIGGIALDAPHVARSIMHEICDVLDENYKLVRTGITVNFVEGDIIRLVQRFRCVVSDSGYTYRQ